MALLMEDGTPDQIYYTTNLQAVGDTRPLTIAGWCYYEDSTSRVSRIWFQDNVTTSQTTRRTIDFSSGANLFLSAGETSGASSAGASAQVTAPANGTWHPFVGQFVSNVLRRAYLGSASGTNTTNITPNFGGTTRLIVNFDPPTSAGHVALAEIAVWEAELSTSQIDMLLAGFAAPRVRPHDLVFYIPAVRNAQNMIGDEPFALQGSPTPVAHPPIIGAIPV